MSKEQDWRRLADEARQRAEHAVNDVEKAAWLKIATGWQRLIESQSAPQLGQQPQTFHRQPQPQLQQQPQQQMRGDK